MFFVQLERTMDTSKESSYVSELSREEFGIDAGSLEQRALIIVCSQLKQQVRKWSKS